MDELTRLKEEYRLKRELKILESRDSFWEFQKLKDPHSFKDQYTYLLLLAISLQSFWENKPISYQSQLSISELKVPDLTGCNFDIDITEDETGTTFSTDLSDTDILIIECPPRHRKSYSLVNFEDWGLGKNPKEIFISCSHNTKIANRFSGFVRDGLKQSRTNATQIIYPDIFPKTRLKFGSTAKEEWSLEGTHVSYVGGGIMSGITSMGGSLIIFDDLVKGSLEAFNENHLDKIWDSYTNTWLSRLEKPYKQIVVMTPWSLQDPAARIQSGADEAGEIVKVLNFKAYSENQNQDDPIDTGMLCPDILDLRRYNIIKSRTEESIFSANYNSVRVDRKGALYSNFRTYTPDEKPTKFEEVFAYIDTADEGSDYLAVGIIGIITKTDEFGIKYKDAYMLDVYFTQDGMEITEPATAKFLIKNHIQSSMKVKIESNNGGRGFSRNVIKILDTEYKSKRGGIMLEWFHQSENKQARINSESNTVMQHIVFPHNWESLWPEYARQMKAYSKDGKNSHDDMADMATGLAEKINSKLTMMEALGMRRG